MSIDRSRSQSPRNGFSLAMLLLFIAIIAVALATIRAAFDTELREETTGVAATRADVLSLLAPFALAGGTFAAVAAIWNRVRWYLWPAALGGGAFVGAAAAAQATLPVSWPVLCLGPALLVLCTVLLVPQKATPDAAQPAEKPSVQRGV
jgi:hypothetical protein